MHTPTHAALGYLVFRSRRDVPLRWILLGSVLPDAPMFVFVAIERWLYHEPLRRIFEELYFEPGWQTVFDVFHSIPLFAVLAAVCAWQRSRSGLFFALSLLLHALVDWPTHLEDAHAYLWPFWRKPLPGAVSYWHADSRFWLVELGLLVAALGALLRTKVTVRERPPARA